jgi:hypothetical protein
MTGHKMTLTTLRRKINEMSKLKNKTTSKTKSNQIQKNKLNEHETQI